MPLGNHIKRIKRFLRAPLHRVKRQRQQMVVRRVQEQAFQKVEALGHDVDYRKRWTIVRHKTKIKESKERYEEGLKQARKYAKALKEERRREAKAGDADGVAIATKKLEQASKALELFTHGKIVSHSRANAREVVLEKWKKRVEHNERELDFIYPQSGRRRLNAVFGHDFYHANRESYADLKNDLRGIPKQMKVLRAQRALLKREIEKATSGSDERKRLREKLDKNRVQIEQVEKAREDIAKRLEFLEDIKGRDLDAVDRTASGNIGKFLSSIQLFSSRNTAKDLLQAIQSYEGLLTQIDYRIGVAQIRGNDNEILERFNEYYETLIQRKELMKKYATVKAAEDAAKN